MTTSITVDATADATPERVWELMAHPACWPAWGRHLRHVRGERDDEAPSRIHEGQVLRVSVGVPPSLRLTITQVTAPARWSMSTAVPLLGTLTSSHELQARGRLTQVRVTVSSSRSGRIPTLALKAYRPVAAIAVRRLARIAEVESAGEGVARLRMCQDTES